MDILGLVLGIVGNVLNVLVFASPLPTFWQIVKMKATQSFSSVPYITTLLSSSLWLYYGLLKPNGILIISISAVGVCFGLFYILVYLIFATRVQRVVVARFLLVVGIFFGIVSFSTLKFAHGNVRLIVVGVFCAANSACMYASPLSVMRLVIKTRSVRYMPFWLSFFLAVSAIVWLAYALVIKDPFLLASNSIGTAFGIVQLSIYAYFSKYGNNEECTQDMDIPKKQVNSTKVTSGDGSEFVDAEIGLQQKHLPLK